MKTQVSKIQFLHKNNFVDVWMLIGNTQFHFTFSLKVDQITNAHLQIITHQKSFGKIFRFNQHIVDEVMNLVWMFYQGASIKLPATVGDFGTPEHARKIQKLFEFEIEV
ncbi:MAG: hypothetical protein PUP92_13635 [Rhizonema sp. PD38]|nr:hypothetical protein [Rhizonema sp. PD38]